MTKTPTARDPAVVDRLSRRLRVQVAGKPQRGIAVPAPGFAAEALQELGRIQLRSDDVEQRTRVALALERGRVHLEGIRFSDLCRLTMATRLACDVLWVLLSARARGYSAFQRQLAEVPLDLAFPEGAAIRIKPISTASVAFHERRLGELVELEIRRRGYRPAESGDEEPFPLSVEIFENRLTVAASLAGEPLYRRGYRAELRATAPLREDIAAGVVERTMSFARVRRPDYFPRTVINPFAGSGTLALEAAAAVLDIPPCVFARRFACEQLSGAQGKGVRFARRRLLEDAAERLAPAASVHLIALDIDGDALSAFENSARLFSRALRDRIAPGVEVKVVTRAADCLRESWVAAGDSGGGDGDALILANPPYGRRLHCGSDLAELFQRVGRAAMLEVERWRGYRDGTIAGAILCPNESSWRAARGAFDASDMAITTSHFTHGGLDMRLLCFASARRQGHWPPPQVQEDTVGTERDSLGRLCS
ncbi:MAG: hypothetical protein HYV63_04345 [Candidatus Schekmanbacteria bacterium]|nr:hypothetical protein [Candidatus Schekmanbacteria bacterium]